MASLLIVTGPPGAGKSAVARSLADRAGSSVLVAGDAFFGFIARGAIVPWLPEAHRQNEVVTQAAAAAAGRYVAGGFPTIYDGMVGPWFLPTFLAAAGLDRVEYVILLPSVDRCLERIGTRIGHGFSDQDATRHMHRQFTTATIDPRHVLPDPPGDVDQVAALIEAARARGSLTYPGSTPAAR